LTIRFGPEVVALMGNLFRHHAKELLIVAGGLLALWLVARFVKRRARAEEAAAQ
jgi:hypothetical protein